LLVLGIKYKGNILQEGAKAQRKQGGAEAQRNSIYVYNKYCAFFASFIIYFRIFSFQRNNLLITESHSGPASSLNSLNDFIRIDCGSGPQ
jgi:hypothetical protein